MATNNPNPHPLQDQLVKAILAYLSFEKREKMHRQIPSLRDLNTAVPYTFEHVHLTPEGLRQTDKKRWHSETKVISRETRYARCPDGRLQETVTTTYDDGEDARLALKYIKDGTRIRQLKFAGLPYCLAAKNPDTFKIHVSELVLETGFAIEMTTETFGRLAQFLDDSVPLKRAEVPTDKDGLPIIGFPIINTCTELALGTNDRLKLADLLRHSDMNHTHLEASFGFYIRDGVHQANFAKDLAQHWINIKKSIGSTFTAPCEEFIHISDVFDELKASCNARKAMIKELGSDFFAHCVIVPLTETSEIVAYAIRYNKPYGRKGQSKYDFALKMEVRPIGSTDAPNFFD